MLEAVRGHVFPDPVTDYERIMGADVAFHRIVAQASQNGPLASLVDTFTDPTATHNLKLTVTGTKNAASSGAWAAVVDALVGG